ncbi:MAG: hypothetical protein GF355_15445, partial [Candidatus Eisenbacteria bacterium]|nr:hypothetical protein [Candidatus Eisenbacteria bacterium]
MALQLKANLGPLAATWRDALRFIAVLKRFQPFLRLQMWPMILATLASLGFTVVTLLEPWPLQIVFDGVLLG